VDFCGVIIGQPRQSSLGAFRGTMLASVPLFRESVSWFFYLVSNVDVLNTVLEILLLHLRSPLVTNTLFFAPRISAGEVEMTTSVL
jgi:hypothetical protein